MSYKSLISKLQTAPNTKAAFVILNRLCANLGFEYYMFTQIGTQDSPSSFKVKLYETNYPDEWMAVYFKNAYLYCDPVAQRLLLNESPFFWSQYISQLDLSDDSKKMMAHAKEFNLSDGVGCSYLKNQGQLYTLTLSSNKTLDTSDTTLMADVYLIGAYLVDLYQKEKQEIHEYQALTQKEKNIVTYGAAGKTDAEIALIAGISINTVRYHWKNIFSKMDSYSRVFAIIRALNLGYVEPHTFEITTNSGSSEIYRKAI